MTNEKSKFKGEYTLDVAKLSEERNRADNKEPFPHQSASFEALTKTLPIPVKGYKGTMLVLPTGGGKTFTAVNWICRNVIAKGGKVLWLAQKADLLDQAANAFKGEIHNATGREVINLRVVSSSSVHANSGSISLTDDILICTTQTAISAYSSGPLDENGNPIKMPLRKFIDNCKDEQLFVVVDEAHHTPAPGCRNLLIAMRESVANLYVLGLTATPTHMDESISGWLKIIYDKGICYEADEENLRVTGILAQPTYIQKNTDIELEVDDRLYNRLEREHKDLPDDILYALADNQSRNNFIVSEYVQNKAQYRKTLIFADRWFQCEYIVTKLKEQGVRADAVYSVVSGQKEGAYISGHGRTNDDNRQVMEDFRANKLDVLVNVRMLSEGTDIPDVKTVMITRQTTSKILQKQMIGRALRGKKAGGGADKDSANIVFFHDKWKRLLSFADIKDGRAEVGKPVQKSRLPMEFISVQLVRLAAADIPYKGFENVPFITYLPVGFWGCEYIIAIEDTEEIVSYQKFVCVYEFNQEKYIKLIDFLTSNQS